MRPGVSGRAGVAGAITSGQFGIIRPCRHRLGGELAAAWTAQLCGLCLALRDDYGQSARIATNYDGLVLSLLVDAQAVASPLWEESDQPRSHISYIRRRKQLVGVPESAVECA